MLYRRLTRRKRKGIGAVLATAVFVFIAISITANLIVWGIIQYASYQSAVDQMRQLDSNKSSESITVPQTLFASSSKYSQTPTLPTPTSTAVISLPITNMNFTTSTAGWVFTKTLPTGVNKGLSGGYDSGGTESGGVGSPSGPGLIYTGVSYFPTTGQTFTGTWTYRFFLDLTKFGLTGSQTFSGTVTASWARIFPTFGSGISTATAKLQVSDGTTTYTVDAFKYTSAGDTAWVTGNVNPATYPSTIAASQCNAPPTCVNVPASFWGTANSPKWYSLILRTDFVVTQSSSFAENRMLYDDVGLSFGYTTYSINQIIDLTLGSEDPTLVQQLTASTATSYSVANVAQTVYLKDYQAGVFTQVSSSFVSTASVNITVTYQAADVQKFISSGKVVEIKIYSVSPNLSTFTVNSMKASVQDFYKDSGHISILVSNLGSSTSHVVDLWILDSSGHTCFSKNLSPCTSFSGIYVSAGNSAVITLAYTWVKGPTTIKVVTDLGNLATLQTIAG